MSLASTCPASLAKVKPFLAKAEQLDNLQPMPAYFLRTYAAHLGMELRKGNPQDKAATTFLMNLLGALEQDKTANPELEKADGRVELTRLALMLFTKADDAERQGQANAQIVMQFQTAMLLFEATTQFVPEMDRIAAPKHKYARFIAIRMGKALQSGEPYVSPNPPEASAPPPGEADDFAPQEEAPAQPQYVAPPPQQPPMGYPPEQNAPAAPPQQTQQYGFDVPAPVAPPQQPPQVAPQPPAPQPQPPVPQQQPPAPAQPQPPAPQPAPAAAPPQPAYVPPPAAPGSAEPSMDNMINSQKFAKQAVAALQFFDHVNARSQLIAALNALDGK